MHTYVTVHFLVGGHNDASESLILQGKLGDNEDGQLMQTSPQHHLELKISVEGKNESVS